MKKNLPNLFWTGFLLGILFWALESVLHTYVFHSGPLSTTLLCEHDPNELWMRLLIMALLTAFGWAAERMVRSERAAKERAIKLNRLFTYVHEIGQSLDERFHNQKPQTAPLEPAPIGDLLVDEDEISRIVQAMQGLSQHLDNRIEGLYALLDLTHEINQGLLVDEVLGKIYESFRSVIPYDRIGVALLEDAGRVLISRWVKSDYESTGIPLGYSAPMAGSSLQRIIQTGEPRIINDLAVYLAEHPNSNSTQKIVAEGIRSNLTCPLVAVGRPIGFIFFSSRKANTYQDLHAEVFRLVAGQLAVVIEKSHTFEQLVREKEKSESLLLNVMPARIIARIKAGHRDPVEAMAEVGVLFADIVGFTNVAHGCSPETVAEFLREVFNAFDALCEKYGVEKIKTIGDAYMACAGVSASENHGLPALARFALDLLTAAAQTRYPDGRPLSIRIGMNVGPVIAGVIGQNKFAYDMWGDTVNLAQRLEAGGKPGYVHVTQGVYDRLKADFTFEPRGEVELKGQGRMTTYFMTGSRAE